MRPPLVRTTKKCPGCQEYFPLEEMYANGRCVPCGRQYVREYARKWRSQFRPKQVRLPNADASSFCPSCGSEERIIVEDVNGAERIECFECGQKFAG